jgi:ribonuclease D
MQEHHRQDWCSEELAALCDENSYNTDPAEAWQRIRHNVHTPHFLSALKYLAQWREKRAQKHNVPKTSILKDDALLNIASSHPKTIDDLRLVRNLKSEVINGRLGAEIIEVLHEAEQNPMPSDICKLDRKSEVHIPNHEQSLMEMLKLLLKIKSQEIGVIAKLIATDEDLRAIIVNQPQKTLTMQGWRYEVFGQYAEQLCKGKLSIAYNPKKKCIEIK